MRLGFEERTRSVMANYRYPILILLLEAVGCAKTGAAPVAEAVPRTAPQAAAQAPVWMHEHDSDFCRALPLDCYQAEYRRRGGGCPEPEPWVVPFARGSADLDAGGQETADELAREAEGWKPTVRLRLIVERGRGEPPEISVRRLRAFRARLQLAGGPPSAALLDEVVADEKLPGPGGRIRVEWEGCQAKDSP